MPRVLKDVSTVDTRSSLVGVPLAIPVLLAPVAALGLYDLGDAFTRRSRGPAGDVVVLCHAHRIALGRGGGHRARPTFLPDLSDGRSNLDEALSPTARSKRGSPRHVSPSTLRSSGDVTGVSKAGSLGPCPRKGQTASPTRV